MKTSYPDRVLGRTGIYMPPLALGCYSMSNAYGQRSDVESRQVIQRAVDQGLKFIDTADFYGWGHNEKLVADALQGRRHEVLLSSKFGYVKNAAGEISVCGTPEYVKNACESSLQRLKTDCLDVYFQHRLDPVVPIEETVGAMADLVAQGKVRYLGLCEVSEATLRKACAIHPISAVQAEYSLWTRDVEQRMLFVCDELGVTLMAFSPLARGMLSGHLRDLGQLAPDDVRRKYPRFSPENFPLNLALVDQLGDWARERGCTQAQLALAWIYAQAPQVVAIGGCDRLDILDENLEALHLSLSRDDVQYLNELFSPGKIHGDRYHASAMAMLDK